MLFFQKKLKFFFFLNFKLYDKGKFKFKLNDNEQEETESKQIQEEGKDQISNELLAECLNCFYGDIENEEPNLAYSILSSISDIAYEEVQYSLVQNIVLSGGIVSIPNFQERLTEELKKMINQQEKFKRIKKFFKHFHFSQCPYSPHLLKLIGASIQSDHKDSELFAINKEEYLNKETYQKCLEKLLLCYFGKPFS